MTRVNSLGKPAIRQWQAGQFVHGLTSVQMNYNRVITCSCVDTSWLDLLTITFDQAPLSKHDHFDQLPFFCPYSLSFLLLAFTCPYLAFYALLWTSLAPLASIGLKCIGSNMPPWQTPPCHTPYWQNSPWEIVLLINASWYKTWMQRCSAFLTVCSSVP